MNARESVGHLSGEESLLLSDNLTQLEQDRLQVLQTRLMETEAALRLAESDARKQIAAAQWPLVQFYAEEYAELMGLRKSINNLMAKAK